MTILTKSMRGGVGLEWENIIGGPPRGRIISFTSEYERPFQQRSSLPEDQILTFGLESKKILEAKFELLEMGLANKFYRNWEVDSFTGGARNGRALSKVQKFYHSHHFVTFSTFL